MAEPPEPVLKPVEFCGSSLDDLRDFPKVARQEAGYQLELVQRGLEPTDWKPMSTIGAGATEIRVQDETGAYRVIYVARFSEAVYVLHCFSKKVQKTSRLDLEKAIRRYKELVEERKGG